MPSANKDRIRITLHVDRELYQLVKIWSKFDEIPISRLFDQVFEPHVERFKYPTPEDWEAVQHERAMEKDQLPEEVLDMFEKDEKFHKYFNSLSDAEKMKILFENAKKQQAEAEAYRKKWIKAFKEEK